MKVEIVFRIEEERVSNENQKGEVNKI